MAAKKKTNGHDSVTVEMVDLLRQLVTETRATNTRLDGMQVEIAGFRAETRNELVDLRNEMSKQLLEIAETNARLDTLREHEERLAKVEAKLEQLTRAA